MRVSFTLASRNTKTGPIPVSTTSSDSCPRSCPLMGHGCYAETGPLAWHWSRVPKLGMPWKAFCAAVAALPVGTLWRHNQAGDLPHKRGRVDRRQLDALVTANAGKRGFTYTHHNVVLNMYALLGANAKGFTINLSADDLHEADAFAKTGMPVVVVLDSRENHKQVLHTPQGRKIVVCPATYDTTVNCKSCQLCAVANRHVIVGFPAHGARKQLINSLIQG